MSTNNNQGKVTRTKNTIIGILAAGLIASVGYLFYAQNQSEKTIQQKEIQISTLANQKSEVQTSFDASLSRLDSLSLLNSNLQNQLTEKNEEIAKVKSEIRSILNNKNASSKELAQAKKLIGELNDKISSMTEEISRLTLANETLTQEKNTLIAEKETLTKELTTTQEVNKGLEQKVDVASTLNASNINITPVNVRSGGKEVVSTKAKKVDKLMVSFDVNNRIIQSGTTDVFVLVVGPDGKPLTNGETNTFSTREEGDKQFTAKLPVEMETATKKNVEFSFAPEKFQEGNYKVQIYQNGYLIGEGVRTLKKGGLFS